MNQEEANQYARCAVPLGHLAIIITQNGYVPS